MQCNRVEETPAEIEPTPTWAAESKLDARPDWRTVDRALRALRHSRAALDAEEMRLLREAEALQIWRPLGTSAANASGHTRVANATAPATEACAHVGTAGASLTVDAHVREAATTTSVSNSGAHVGATEETIPVASTGTCSGVANKATSIADAAGRMEAANDGVPIIDARAHVGAASRLDAAILRTQAKAALTGLGWKPAIANAAVAAAVAAAQGTEVTLEKLIFESLRRCPSPKA